MAAGLLALLPALPLEAQSNRSLTGSESGTLRKLRGTTVVVPIESGRGTDNIESLMEQILLLRASIKSLTEALALANSEAEAFKRQSNDLSLKLEALGIASVEKDQSKLEQRLLAAVRDLRLMKKQHDDAVNQLVRLIEAVQVIMKSAENIDPEMRMKVETEMRKTNEVLGAPAAPNTEAIAATLSDGMVVDVKNELSLVVANIGQKQGVQIGMPFQVWRENKRIGEVRVVDVRERICGAIIQNLDSEKEPIKTGDRLKVDARQ